MSNSRRASWRPLTLHCTTRGMRAHAVQHCARAALPSGPCEPHCTKLHDMHVAITGFTGAHNLQIRFVPAQTLLKSDGSDAGAPLGSKVVGSASLELAAREPESTTTAPPTQRLFELSFPSAAARDHTVNIHTRRASEDAHSSSHHFYTSTNTNNMNLASSPIRKKQTQCLL